MDEIKISTILPVYNGSEFIESSINSILNQTFEDFELIIINDGSTDNSLEIIKNLQKKDKRITLINSQNNEGLQKSLNKGMKVAKGKYIARMDSDDISSKKRFEIQHNFLEKNPDVFLVGSSAIIINRSGEKVGVLKKFNNCRQIKKKLEKRNCMIHPSIMFRNKRNLLYREKFKCSEDYDLYLRILSLGKKITNLPDLLIKYRISEGSFVSTMPNQIFYFEKAKEFYQQRKKQNFEDYSQLLPPKETINPQKFEKISLKSKILIQLQDNQSKNARKNIKLFFKKYKFDKTIFIYYLLSFLPQNLFGLIQRTII